MGTLAGTSDIYEVANVAPKVDVQSESAARSKQVSDGERVSSEVKQRAERCIGPGGNAQ